MVDAAFRSGELESNEAGVYQREIVDWIAANYDGFSETHRRQNLTQGVYIALNKFYVKMPDPDAGDTLPKKNRWLPKMGPGESNGNGSSRPSSRKGDNDDDGEDNVDDEVDDEGNESSGDAEIVDEQDEDDNSDVDGNQGDEEGDSSQVGQKRKM
jgi:hypothetical protein